MFLTKWKTDSVVLAMDVCMCCKVGDNYNGFFNNTQCTGPVNYEVTNTAVPGMVAEFEWPDFLCGTELLTDACQVIDLPMTEDGWKLFWGELSSTSTIMFTIALSVSTSDMPINMVKAMNCLRCAFVSGYFNIWLLMGASYYFARYWAFHDWLGSYFKSWYPYVCTCTKDIEFIQSSAGVPIDHQKIYQTCSELTE